MSKGNSGTRSNRGGSNPTSNSYDSLSSKQKEVVDSMMYGLREGYRELTRMEDEGEASRFLDEQQSELDAAEKEFRIYLNSLNLSSEEKRRLVNRATNV